MLFEIILSYVVNNFLPVLVVERHHLVVLVNHLPLGSFLQFVCLHSLVSTFELFERLLQPWPTFSKVSTLVHLLDKIAIKRTFQNFMPGAILHLLIIGVVHLTPFCANVFDGIEVVTVVLYICIYTYLSIYL